MTRKFNKLWLNFMVWLNVDKPTKKCTLHMNSSCTYSNSLTIVKTEVEKRNSTKGLLTQL